MCVVVHTYIHAIMHTFMLSLCTDASTRKKKVSVPNKATMKEHPVAPVKTTTKKKSLLFRLDSILEWANGQGLFQKSLVYENSF